MERASDRKIRHHNTPGYRLSHWPIWIFVFFITPGPLTFKLFESGVNLWMVLWLGGVMAVTAVAGLRGRLPGCEPRPYIIRFTEDKPNTVIIIGKQDIIFHDISPLGSGKRMEKVV